MFLGSRLLSGRSPAAGVLLGLVFVAGMAVGAALKDSVRPAFATTSAEPAQMFSGGTGLQDLRVAAGGHTAEVLRVNDGDTFEARVHIWPGMQVTTRVRLRGIDAPEFGARCSEEYRMAQAARDALQRLVSEGGVTIGRIDFDKYGGRVVASAATRQTPDISAALLKAGIVRAYDGGRREMWCGPG
jgi:endonuclease YncB( thermonuclease family)